MVLLIILVLATMSFMVVSGLPLRQAAIIMHIHRARQAKNVDGPAVAAGSLVTETAIVVGIAIEITTIATAAQQAAAIHSHANVADLVMTTAATERALVVVCELEVKANEHDVAHKKSTAENIVLAVCLAFFFSLLFAFKLVSG
jgi:hypothetical protein